MKIGESPLLNRLPVEGRAKRHGLSPHSKPGDLTNLPPGRLIKGLVVSVSPEGATVLSVDQKTFTAQSLVPLTAGQEIWFEILAGGDQPLLGLAGKKGAVIDIIKLLFSLNQRGAVVPEPTIPNRIMAALSSSQGKLNADFEQFLKLFAGSIIDAESDPKKVLKTSQALGLWSELRAGSTAGAGINKQLADFIALLGRGPESGGLPGFEEGQKFSQLLKMFDLFAELNSQPAPADIADFFLFPCFFAGESGWGEWIFRFGQDEGGDDDTAKTYSISLFLTMSSLGELHIQVRTFDNTLQGIFSVASEDSGRYLSDRFPELSAVLQGHGFQPVRLSCQVTKSANLERLKEELTVASASDTFSLLDVTI